MTEGVLSWAHAFAKTRKAMAARERPEQKHAQHDAELGWTNPPSRVVRDLYGPGKHFTTNAQGFRAREETLERADARRERCEFVEGHYSEAGNTLVAEALLPELQRLFGLTPIAQGAAP